MTDALAAFLQRNKPQCHPIIPLAAVDRVLPLDLSTNNPLLTPEQTRDTETFSRFIHHILEKSGSKYGIGGYNEHRNLYERSEVFDGAEPRRLHLGVDIWGPAGTPVHSPLPGQVHSFAYNGSFGDYGATLILKHQLEGYTFHTLYGHLSLYSIQHKNVGQPVAAGEAVAYFGLPAENGNWPPHLHFQLVIDMDGMAGDYPGVCRLSEKQKYLQNCPDANLLLNL